MSGQRRLLPLLIIGVTLFFLPTSICFAQTADSKPKPTASVTGRVTVGDKPAAGIIVAINGISQQTLIAQTTTDAEGKYRIAGLAPGQVTVATVAPTYVLPASPTFTPGRVLNLSADEVIEGIDFKLTRGGVITGRVTDSEGKPVVEERISLNQIDDGRGPTQAVPGRPMIARGANPYTYSTDDRGIYRLYGVPAGRYLVSVGDDAGGTWTVRGAGYYPRTYSPDTTDASKASIVELSEGGEAKNIDINLGLRARTYTVSGRIIDADSNQPLAGVDYSFGSLRQDQNQTYFSGTNSPGTPTNVNGEFRIEGVEPGRYGIMATSSNFLPNNFLSVSDRQLRVYSDPVQFEITDGDVSGLEIKARRGLSLSGAVITEGITDKRVLAMIPRLLVSGFVQPSGNGIQTYGGVVTSPIAAEDVARVVAALLTNPQPHIGKIYHLTGPQSENMDFYAQEYSKALGRTITYQDIPVEPWRDALLERGFPVHVVNHLVTMADLHRVGRFDRMSDEVRTLTGQAPLSVQEFVRKNAAAFTASAKEA